MSDRARSIVMNLLLAGGCVAGAAFSTSTWRHDVVLRRAAAEFARRFTIDIRRPEVASSLAIAPSGDFASDLVADTTLRDVVVPVNLNSVPRQTRTAWLDVVTNSDEQMARATDLLLDAIAERPGWPYHQALLGQIVYLRDARALSPEIVTRYRRWSLPLYSAAMATPNDSSLWQSLALSYLQTWPQLAPVHRSTAAAVFRTAFSDVEFVRNAFGASTEIIGTEQSISYLPESAKPLRAAFNELLKRGDTERAWMLHQRWDAAEWRERAQDLAAIESRLQHDDVETARVLCFRWAEAHPARTYSSPKAAAQIRHLLQIWPPVSGTYPIDPRGELLHYLAQQAAVDGPTFRAVTEWVDNLPASIRVAAAAVAGEPGDVLTKLAAEARPDKSAALMTVARFAASRKDCAAARSAIAQLEPPVREACAEPLVTMLDACTGKSAAEVRTAVDLRIGESKNVCGRAVFVRAQTDQPVIADVLVDDSRLTTVLLQGTAQIEVPDLAQPLHVIRLTTAGAESGS